jgi:hypothetical protein
MYEATNVSRRLKGTAYTRIAGGSTFKFQVASHIRTKPKSQPRIVVLRSDALLESEKIAAANKNPHTTQTSPFRGSDGNVIPSDL